ncbi:hypothetical protein D0T56_04205 [Dysgonomonas sp. 520]|nr:hypothetical protein [Dysgonomonas sp. 520]
MFFMPSALIAQVGVNTETPQGVFHVDAQKNTSGNTNVSDDVIVNSQGNVGIGTNSPSQKLHVAGNSYTSGYVGIGNSSPAYKLDIRTGGTSSSPTKGFRLVDGNQASGKVLTSNANGIATWEQPGFSEFTQIPFFRNTKIGPLPAEETSATFMTGHKITFPAYGTYSVTLGVRVSAVSSIRNIIERACIQLLPGNDIDLWGAATRFKGAYEVYATNGGTDPRPYYGNFRFYFSQNITVDASTGLEGYLAIYILTKSGSTFPAGNDNYLTFEIGDGNDICIQCTGGSFVKIN